MTTSTSGSGALAAGRGTSAKNPKMRSTAKTFVPSGTASTSGLDTLQIKVDGGKAFIVDDDGIAGSPVELAEVAGTGSVVAPLCQPSMVSSAPTRMPAMGSRSTSIRSIRIGSWTKTRPSTLASI